MAMGAIGFFGRGDLMRQRMYWNGQRSALPLSSFAQSQVVDVGMMPGSVEPAATNQPAATSAVSGYGSFSGWGRVTPFQALTYPAMAVAGPGGWAAIAANEKSLRHARQQRDHFKKLYMKLRAKNKKDRRLAKVKQTYLHWAQIVLMRERYKKAKVAEHKHFKATKKAIRHGRAIPLTLAQRRAARRITGSTTMGIQTGAQAAASAGLATMSSQGAMVPPGSYDVMPAQALAPVSSSSGYAPAQLVAQDVDTNDDGTRDDITADGTPISADGSDGTTSMSADDGGGGIMARVSDFFGNLPKWALILGVLGIGGLAFSRTRRGKIAFAKLSRKFKGSSSAE